MFKAAACQILTGSGFSCIELGMSENIFGIISIIVGIIALGLSFTGSVIAVIPIILACALAIYALTDFLAYKWTAVTGLVFAVGATCMMMYWGKAGAIDTSLKLPSVAQVIERAETISAANENVKAGSRGSSPLFGVSEDGVHHSIIPWSVKFGNGVGSGNGSSSANKPVYDSTIWSAQPSISINKDGETEYNLIGYWREPDTKDDHYRVSAVIDYDTITTYYYTNDLLKGSYSLQWTGSYKNLVGGEAWVSKGYRGVMNNCKYASTAYNKTFSYTPATDTIDYDIDYNGKNIHISLSRANIVGGILPIGENDTSYTDASILIENSKKAQTSVSGNDKPQPNENGTDKPQESVSGNDK